MLCPGWVVPVTGFDLHHTSLKTAHGAKSYEPRGLSDIIGLEHLMPNVPPHSHGTWEAQNRAVLLPIPNYLPIPSFRSVAHFQPTLADHELTFNTARPNEHPLGAAQDETARNANATLEQRRPSGTGVSARVFRGCCM